MTFHYIYVDWLEQYSDKRFFVLSLTCGFIE